MADMTEFALFHDDKFVRVQSHVEKPEPNPAKGYAWYPVVSSVTGPKQGWAVKNGEAVQTVQPTPKRRTGTFTEFMGLFTESEQLALATAAMQDAGMKLWYDQAVGASSIDLDSDKLRKGFDFAVQANLITSARKDEILGADFNA